MALQSCNIQGYHLDSVAIRASKALWVLDTEHTRAVQGRAKEIVFENCYIHDSLASGINAKGAQQISIRNNTVVRAGYRGASVGEPQNLEEAHMNSVTGFGWPVSMPGSTMQWSVIDIETLPLHEYNMWCRLRSVLVGGWRACQHSH